MMQINLLPWRERNRKLKKIRFAAGCILGAFLACCLIIFFHIRLYAKASVQQQVNQYLQSEISYGQNILNEMSSKEKRKEAIEKQLYFIINVRQQNYDFVYLLNQLITLVPEKILLTKISGNQNEVLLSGVAETEDDISHFMKEMDKWKHFYQPALSSLNQNKQKEDKKQFQIKMVKKENDHDE